MAKASPKGAEVDDQGLQQQDEVVDYSGQDAALLARSADHHGSKEDVNVWRSRACSLPTLGTRFWTSLVMTVVVLAVIENLVSRSFQPHAVGESIDKGEHVLEEAGVQKKMLTLRFRMESADKSSDGDISEYRDYRELEKHLAQHLPELPEPYYNLAQGSCCCPAPDRIKTKADCNEALAHWSANIDWEGNTYVIPSGCAFRPYSTNAPHGHWNGNSKGRARGDIMAICKRAEPTTVTTTERIPLTTERTTVTLFPMLPEPYYYLDQGTCCCPAPDRIETKAECNEALGHWASEVDWEGSVSIIPSGCSYRPHLSPHGHWNQNGYGKARHDMVPICKGHPQDVRMLEAGPTLVQNLPREHP